MKAAWWTRMAAVGGVACGVGAAAAFPTACTVTSSSGDGGTTIDEDTGTGDSGGGTDGGTTDSSANCPAIGNTSGASITFGTDTAGERCNSCMSTNCCAPTTTCFASADGGTSDCDALHTCIRGCETNDAGQDCINTCKDVHSAQSATDQAAFESCYVNSCRSTGACP